MSDSKDRVSVENRLTRMETKLEELMTNHLPHIESKIDRATWFTITTLVGIVVILLVK